MEPDASLRLGQGPGARSQEEPPPDLLLGNTSLGGTPYTTGDASVLENGQGHRGSPSTDWTDGQPTTGLEKHGLEPQGDGQGVTAPERTRR